MGNDMYKFARLTILLVLVITLCGAAAWSQTKPKWSAEYEKKIGTEATAEIEKQWKVIADHPQQKDVAELITRIATVSSRPEVKYTVKIVDTAEVNAFSLPGGFVYVTKGLLADVQSDDELAGVLAHEITHNAFYDSLERAEKSKKLFMGSIAATLGAMVLGAKGDKLNAALAAGEYIRLGVLSNYSLDIESRADRYAIEYLIATKKYNPVGMLTFMERLAAQERHKPKQELGVYADHPDTDVRCRLIIRQLEDDGIDINRRAVTKWEHPKAEEKDVDGKKVAVLSLWGVELLRTDQPVEGKAPLDRVTEIAATLTKALADGLSAYDITVDTNSPQPRVMGHGQTLIEITAEDATTANLSPQDLAKQIASKLDAAMHKEDLDRRW